MQNFIQNIIEPVKKAIIPLIMTAQAVLIPSLNYTPPRVAENAPQRIETAEVVNAPIIKPKPTEAQWASCQCVPYVREFVPNLPYGDAKYQQRNSYPTEGGVVIFEDHIGYISKLWGNVIEVKHRYLSWNGVEYECLTMVDWYGYGDESFKGFAEY